MYIVPQLEHFFIGFEYEEFETVLLDSYKDKDGHFIIPGFKTYSNEYFVELHSNDKYWKHRKWVSKIADKNTIFMLSSTYHTEQYIPLGINNIFRIKPENLISQWEKRLSKIKMDIT